MFLITATLSVFYLQFQKKIITEGKIEDGRILTTVLASNIRLGLFAEDKKKISESLRTAFGVKDVIGVCAYNKAGQLLYRETRQDWDHTDICIKKSIATEIFNEGTISFGVRFFEDKNNIEFWAPVESKPSQFTEESLYFDSDENPTVSKNSFPVGFVGVIYSKIQLQEAIHQVLKKGILLLIFFLGLVFTATYFIIREVTKPLKQLIGSIKDYGIDVEAKDEVGLLADTFSRMLTTLEKSINTVNTLKIDLENKVEDLELEIKSRKTAEAALRESENKFRSISEGIADGIALVQEGKFAWLNHSFCEIFGYNHYKELLGRKTEDLLRPDQQEPSSTRWQGRTYLEPGPPYQIEVSRKDGNRIILDVKATQSAFAGKPATELIIRNVTEKMELEKERKEMEIKALSLSKLATIGEIATGIAHEINQPLTFIKIAYQATLRDLENDRFEDEKTRHNFRDALRQVERIALITDHLRNFGRKNISTLTQVSLPKVFDNALILMAERIRLSNLELIKEIEDGLPEIYGNKMQLEQVFINLMQNSIDAMEGDRDGKLKVSMRQNGNFLKTTFSDSGPGIEPSVAENIFEPFFTTKEEEKGVGLGLAISNNIIQEHHGTIEYCRIKDWGATFLISLPVSVNH
ncbi:MAG: PAS domain S-box protein [Deltaproteobacteria bacterium]|jgi:PAS domain S-box-containing protein|nr:PAS domain S-box protein [Deltaproteobacteria bacterium]